MKNKPLIETTTRVQPIDYFPLHHGQTLHTHQKSMLIQSLLHSVLIICLLIPQLACAAFWVEDFKGGQEEYRLIRQGQEVKVKAPMLLKTDDKISVLSEAGELHLLQDDDEREVIHILTKQNSPFKVPESGSPSGLIQNILALGERWKAKISEEETKEKPAATRGGGPVLILGASDLKNHLIVGSDSLVVHWSGGEPPYRVRILDEDDNIIIEQNDIQQTNVTLTGITLSTGNYGLEVLGDSSSSYIALTVVEPIQVPSIYHKILASHASEKVKQRAATLALASEPRWLFQSLQLAERYELQNFKQNILGGYTPDPINEMQF